MTLVQNLVIADIFKNFILFIFNWSVYPLISSTKIGPRPELEKSESQHLGARRIEGFVHDSSFNLIQLGCLKRVMPKKPFSGTGEIMHAAFEAIHPGRGNAYT